MQYVYIHMSMYTTQGAHDDYTYEHSVCKKICSLQDSMFLIRNFKAYSPLFHTFSSKTQQARFCELIQALNLFFD